MRNMRWSLAGLFACGLPVACADPCIDDGRGQQGEGGSCPPANTGTEGTSDVDTDPLPPVDSTSSTTLEPSTEGLTGSQTGDTETTADTLDGTDTDTTAGTDTGTDTTETAGETDTDADTDTDTDTDTGGGSLWCVDADGDGFGDPDMCQQSKDPVPGSVDNDDDCDDGNDQTYPGAAPNDDPNACMQDEDGDDWGDDAPPAGVDPGTDCVDEDVSVFPGAAANETPPDLCTQDEDGDDWGDTEPPPGADPGTDCADADPFIFPGAAINEMPPDLCAEDQDGDGWGDTDPPPGVDPGTDCADNNLYTYPGAAPNDDPAACMQDEDDDDWGDDVPPPGVQTGTDCDDANPDAFPGAAPSESPADLCTVDGDGDGWGDANPGGGGGGGTGPQPGSDCYDTNPDLNPDGVQLTAITPYEGAPVTPRVLQTVNEGNGALAPFVTLLTPLGTIPNANLVSATFNEDLEIFASDLTAAQLYSIDYELTCGVGLGEATPVGMPYGVAGTDIICGLEFGNNGGLYGISNNLNQLLTFDPVTGQPVGAPLNLVFGDGSVLDINSCGMARDCTEGRLLVASGGQQTIYAVDETTGVVELLRDLTPYLGGAWTPVGLEYDPVSRTAFLSTGGALYQVDLENDVPPVFVGAFAEPVSNLQYLPICSP